MRTVYKYPIKITDTQQIEIKAHANIFHVGLDPNGTPCLWAVVETNNPEFDIEVYVVGTGNPMPEDARRPVGSFVQGPFVWHVFIR